MNEQEYFAAAKRLARQLLVESGWSNQQRLEFAYELITSHEPDSREMELLTQGLEQLRESYADEPDAAAALTAEIEGLTATERVELAAMTMVVNSLINLDITKTRE